MLYLDYNATAPLLPAVINAMTDTFKVYGNPSSIHNLGRQARALMECVRNKIANVLETEPAQIVFTSGATEANNMALNGFLQKNAKIIMSAIEHESMNQTIPNKIMLPVLKNGQIDLDQLGKILAEERSHHQAPLVVSIMLANNETGVIQPLKKAVEIAKHYNAWIHCDCAQALGKIPFSFKDLEVDSLAISAHKIGGPKGVGALILNENLKLPSLIIGGGQERGRRAGTENILGIVGFGTAIEEIFRQPWGQIRKLRDTLEKRLKDQFSEIPIYGQDSPRLPNTTYIGMPGVSSQTQLMAFDLENIALSSGTACSSGKVKPSHVLKAMGIQDKAAGETLRISLGWTTTQQDIERLIDVWCRIYRRQTNKIPHVA
ncbi:MAG: cysteine desulfurase [Alphaproteobacteria bacterium]|nr:cysteine desulfurase [Alphaproteobacteria bacterium]